MTFLDALKHILDVEGGYVNDPLDPGGATNMGITIETLRAWRGDPRLDEAAVADLTREEACEIYEKRYWTPMRCGDMPDGVDLMAFDAAVQHGIFAAAQILQTAVGAYADGVVGPKTLAAIDAFPGDLVAEFAARRMVFYAEALAFGRYGLGWSRRLMRTVIAASEAAGR